MPEEILAFNQFDWQKFLCLTSLYGFAPTNLEWLFKWRQVDQGGHQFEQYWWQWCNVGYFMVDETQRLVETLAAIDGDGGAWYDQAVPNMPESEAKAALEQLGRAPLDLVSRLRRIAENRVLEWPVIRTGVYGVRGVPYYARREARFTEAIKQSYQKGAPTGPPNWIEDPVLIHKFMWYVCAHGPELTVIPTLEDDIRKLGEEPPLEDDARFRLKYLTLCQILAVSELYGFAPHPAAHQSKERSSLWNSWPYYYYVFNPEEPCYWWDCGPLHINWFSADEWASLGNALSKARLDDYQAAESEVSKWIPSKRRRRYRDALQEVTPQILDELIPRIPRLDRWHVFRDGTVAFDERQGTF